MNEHEYSALVGILNRAPVTQAEALWLNTLLTRLAAEIKAKADRQNDANDTP